LKAGALAGTAVLVLGAVAGLPLTGPASGAGGPFDKGGATPKEVAREPAKATPTVGKPESKPARLAAEYEPFQGEWVVATAEMGNASGTDALGIDDQWRVAGNVLATGS